MRRISISILAVLSLFGLQSCTSLENFTTSENLRPGLNLNIINDFNRSYSKVSQALPENWELGYQPPGGSMRTDRDNDGYFWDLGFGLEPKLTTASDWEFGLPVFYSFTCLGSGDDFTIDKVVAETTLDWWDNVPVFEVNLRKTSPAIGISVRKDHWKFQCAFQEYKLFTEDFKGVDVVGGKNYAKAIGKRDIDSGWGQRFDVSYLFYETEDKGGWSIGGYYERNGSEVWLAGISLKYTFGL
ncbi:hypothetical protein KJA13_01040 [Patescibacteria group bacterium]|nr:hypothetical protein [Patescibacteria group bacterium]